MTPIQKIPQNKSKLSKKKKKTVWKSFPQDFQIDPAYEREKKNMITDAMKACKPY